MGILFGHRADKMLTCIQLAIILCSCMRCCMSSCIPIDNQFTRIHILSTAKSFKCPLKNQTTFYVGSPLHTCIQVFIFLKIKKKEKEIMYVILMLIYMNDSCY